MTRSCSTLIAALGVIWLAAPQVLAQGHGRPATFDLVGVVRFEGSGRPAAGVVVVADSAGMRRAVTDSAGHYRFLSLPRGTYTVSARRLGYYVERREISVTCPLDVVDDRGRVLTGGGPCDPSPATLNFYLRLATVR